MDKDGKFLGLKVDTIATMGAYLSTFAPCVPTYLYATLLAGQYTTPVIYCEVRAVFTNTVPVDAYRGAGRPEATYLLERLVETAAREMKLDPVEMRRRNFIRRTSSPTRRRWPCSTTAATTGRRSTQALKLVDYDGFADAQARRRSAGKLRGIGFSTYIEACGIAPSAVVGSLGAGVGLCESAQVRVNPTGTVTVFTGSHSHGQGHETTFAQLVADTLGIPIENVDIVHGDTGRSRSAWAPTARARSRSAARRSCGRCDKIIDKGKKIAAHLLEASVEDIEFKDGKFPVAGTDKTKTIGEIALRRLRAAQLPGRPRAGPRRDRVLRSAELHLPGAARTSARSRSIPTPA